MNAESSGLWTAVTGVMEHPLFVPAAAVVGTILTLTTLYYNRLATRRKEPKKELSFGVLNRTVLLSSADSIANDVYIAYKGEQIVGMLTSLTVSLMNTGQLPIALADFEGALKISLEGTQRVFSVATLGTSPAHLAPDVTCTDTGITVQPLLLNSAEFIALRVIVENKERVTARLQSRILGVTSHPTLRMGRHPGYEVGGLVFWGCFGLTGVVLWGIVVARGTPMWVAALLFFLWPGIAFAALYSTVRDIIKIRRTRWMGEDTKDLGTST